jgi:ribosomal protein S18 acetylase RimI-like enzyme
MHMGQRRDTAGALRDYPKEVILNDGTGVTLRPLRAGDTRALHEMFMRFSEDDRWFLNHDVSDPQRIESWMNDLDVQRLISLVALLRGRVIANAALMMKRYGAKSHIGKIRISVDPEYRERRLGTWMLLDLHNVAMALGLKRLTMRLVQGRDASIIAAVKRLAFEEVAVLRDYVLDRHGRPHDLVIMTKCLPHRLDIALNEACR